MKGEQANASETMDMPAHEKTYSNFIGFLRILKSRVRRLGLRWEFE